jgi:hypothetical protein
MSPLPFKRGPEKAFNKALTLFSFFSEQFFLPVNLKYLYIDYTSVEHFVIFRIENALLLVLIMKGMKFERST